MESVNIQSVVKASAPKSSPVAVAPVNVAVSEIKSEASGKELPLVEKELNALDKNREKIEVTVSELNSFVQSIQRGIQFSVHEETGRSIITITDRETGEELRKFPSEQVLSIAAHIAETLAVPEEAGRGLLVNSKA